MAFKTRTDLSFNRQAKQREQTEWVLPGVTRFGLPDDELSEGPNLNTVELFVGVDNISSVLSYDVVNDVKDYSLGVDGSLTANQITLITAELDPFTTANEIGDNQTVEIWTGIEGSSVEVNGETRYTEYELVRFYVEVVATVTQTGDWVEATTAGHYDVFRASALDYTGDYIWVDVRGIAKTENLMITQAGVGSSTTDLGLDNDGNVVIIGSDERLKENVKPIQNALEKVLGLEGITYQWKDRKAGGEAVRIGFIAQDVQKVVPELVHNVGSTDYLGVHYNNAVPLIIEAIKELANGYSSSDTKHTTIVKELNTEVIYSEDNAIELNFNGTHESAKSGGIILLKGVSEEENAGITINDNGDWEFHPGLAIPKFTPQSTQDLKGNEGNLTYDDDYLYIKTTHGWKRTGLENF